MIDDNDKSLVDFEIFVLSFIRCVIHQRAKGGISTKVMLLRLVMLVMLRTSPDRVMLLPRPQGKGWLCLLLQ